MMYPWLQEAAQEFMQRVSSGRMAHACLLTGAQGLGKLEFARQMAVTMLCQEKGEQACGVCRSCQLFASGAHPDFRLLSFEVNPKSDKMRTELVIEQVRDLNGFMQLTRGISPRKVALIHPAEAMNRNTANALLKTLEEPPGEAVLILLAHDPSRLAATIRSRCQVIQVRLPDEALAVDWLVHKTGEDGAAARIALQASAGSPLRAEQMLAQGHLEQFRLLEELLDSIQAGQAVDAQALQKLYLWDQEDLWRWLSLISAQRLRDCFSAQGRAVATANRVTAAPGMSHLARQINLLQSLADRNRRLLATPLRKDLLLRDWLIQWSRLSGS